jgi:signal transduction histidine kinase/ActR/RegA family two-component response regulator
LFRGIRLFSLGAASEAETILETQLFLGTTSSVALLLAASWELEAARKAAEKANRLKSEFLANMSHEIRTPMTAILGYAQIMSRDSALSPDLRDKVRTINRAGEHLLALINDVLEMSKIEAGSITRNDSAFDLHALLDDIIEIYSGRAKAKRLAFALERSPRVPRYIISDESKVRQSLVNLVGNAVKFTTTGGIAVIADAKMEADDSHTVTLAVRDSGPGLNPEEIGKLFRPFVQSDAGKRIGGTGLGLAISRQYARLLGGDITVESQLGNGATFVFSFRAGKGGAVDVAAQESAPPVSRLVPGQTARVLIAEDVEASRTMLCQLLTELGFEVRATGNGVEALAAFREWRPQAVLMDMQMPVMDGYEATRRIKATPEGREAFVLALTASALEEDKAAVLACGADGFMRKPFKENELVALLGRRLNLRFHGGETSAPIVPVYVVEADFSAVPVELRAGLIKAADEGDFDGLLARCGELAAAGHPEAAEALRSRVNDFDYDGVLALLGGA